MLTNKTASNPIDLNRKFFMIKSRLLFRTKIEKKKIFAKKTHLLFFGKLLTRSVTTVLKEFKIVFSN